MSIKVKRQVVEEGDRIDRLITITSDDQEEFDLLFAVLKDPEKLVDLLDRWREISAEEQARRDALMTCKNCQVVAKKVLLAPTTSSQFCETCYYEKIICADCRHVIPRWKLYAGHDCEPVEDCPSCGATYCESEGHRCPPPTPSTPPIDDEQATGSWKQLLDALNAKVRAYFKEAQFDLQGDHLTLSFPYAFHHSKAQEHVDQVLPLVRRWLGEDASLDLLFDDTLLRAKMAKMAETAEPRHLAVVPDGPAPEPERPMHRGRPSLFQVPRGDR